MAFHELLWPFKTSLTQAKINFHLIRGVTLLNPESKSSCQLFLLIFIQRRHLLIFLPFIILKEWSLGLGVEQRDCHNALLTSTAKQVLGNCGRWYQNSYRKLAVNLYNLILLNFTFLATFKLYLFSVAMYWFTEHAKSSCIIIHV